MPAGRPRSIDSEKLARLEHALRLGTTIQYACAYASIPSSTLYDNMAEDPELSAKMEMWKGDKLYRALSKEDKLIEDENAQVIQNVINKSHPDRKDRSENIEKRMELNISMSLEDMIKALEDPEKRKDIEKLALGN